MRKLHKMFSVQFHAATGCMSMNDRNSAAIEKPVCDMQTHQLLLKGLWNHAIISPKQVIHHGKSHIDLIKEEMNKPVSEKHGTMASCTKKDMTVSSKQSEASAEVFPTKSSYTICVCLYMLHAHKYTSVYIIKN